MSSPSSDAQRGAANKGLLIGCGLLVLLVVVGYFSVKGTYNTFVEEQERVEEKWANLESAYKRRADLIPQLMGVVQGARDFEQETFTEVTEARSKVNQVNISGGAPTEAELQQFMSAQQGLGSALSRLLVTMEAYPELRATEAFRDMQSQVEGTENRINTARTDYIQAVRDYNTSLRRFPNNLLAGAFGFETRPQLEQEAGVREVPEIDFGDG